MSLIELPDLIQGTDEWLEQRRGIVTASVVGQLVTPSTIKPANNDKSRALVVQLVAERIAGWIDPVFVSDDMLRGHEDEPRAIETYVNHGYADSVRVTGFMVRREDDWTLGYSPDGLVGDDGLVEVKAPRAKKHVATVLSGEVPPEHMPQLQAGLLVSGRKWIDFLSFCGGLPMWRKRVYPDQRWFDAITAAAKQFEKTAAEMVAAYEAAVVGLPMTERMTDLELTL